jgi:Tfp pilus assembly protein PilO
MDQLKRFVWPLATAGVVFLIVVIGLLAWVVPEGKKVSTANTQKATLLTQQSSLQLEITTLEHESSTQPKNCSELRQDQTLVPNTPTVDLFLHQISQLATTSGTATPSVTITSSGTTAVAGADTVGIGLTVSGTYQQILNFLQGLDTANDLPRLYTVSSVSLSTAQGSSSSTASYSLTLNGSIYYTTGSSDVCSASNPNPASSST